MTFILSGGPRDGERVDEVPDGYKSMNTGHGIGRSERLEMPTTATWQCDDED